MNSDMITQITQFLQNMNEQFQQDHSEFVSVKTEVIGVEQENKEEEKDCCPICLDELKDVGLVTLECSHKMHLTCFQIFTKTRTGKKCPLCRGAIEQPPLPRRMRNLGQTPPPPSPMFQRLPEVRPRWMEELEERTIREFRPSLSQTRILSVFGGTNEINRRIIQRRLRRNGVTITDSTVTTNLSILFGNRYLLRVRRGWYQLNPERIWHVQN